MAFKQKTARLDQGFDIQPQDDGSTRLTVRGSGLGALLLLAVFVWMLLLSMLIGSMLLPIINPQAKAWLLPFIILPVALTLAWQLFRLRSFEMTIANEGIRQGSTLYPMSEISEVFIDNSRGGDAVVSGVVVGGAFAVASQSAVIGANRWWRRRLAAVSYRVNLRHGRRVVRLASALDEDKATALFNYLTRRQ
ncbi:hypothetical protein [Ketogulonicigenium vulgare]|uniref:Uncharacterized protein n=1 Tax=Ketogulonicigenium vulgare (strain WSH-001) TaxID=759362 RepID=F9Y957_KETVW|nr:hypothetical protein [Ketogulonicigenium vulgare]ADO43095.1 hypothetical protein EIO_1980 [Ketogulonicigenium vulgare Y25]AEM41274.1 hypothetical protein KVU_1435 [Ketogulonicigenium vulgare WSH-001]ALJ81411.1 hypothetical protein KVH_09595 [Ketogulonicigenium vulgare]ANW34136.1 hypothetical protein KvSKV_09545 [Ketogulonicigenium vulgare]AOZ55008.1 hypothetical protein KVC_2001 [Ketogulonicigenium vulgare]